MNLMRASALLILLALASICPAHTDLQLQIDRLTHELADDPVNTDLLMKRGDLYRRHQNWHLARGDFARVRQLQPDHAYVDWFEGRLEVEAGEPQKGIALLDKFVRHNPQHVIALQNRAQGLLLLGQPLPAAHDYLLVVQHSKTPGPELYRACASAYMAAGKAYYEQAMDVVREGLNKVPGEISLTGLGVDISLARSDLNSAQTLIGNLPGPVLGLQQWQVRTSMLDCLAGRKELAAKGFTDVIEDRSEARETRFLISEEWLEKLAADPTPEICRAAQEYAVGVEPPKFPQGQADPVKKR